MTIRALPPGQTVRACSRRWCAPPLTAQERFAYRPQIRVDQSDDGAVLDIRWQRGATGDGFDVTWVGPEGAQALGRVAPGLTADRLSLPAAPAGALVRLRFLDAQGRAALPPHTYRVAPRSMQPVPAGDQAALDALIGPASGGLSLSSSTPCPGASVKSARRW